MFRKYYDPAPGESGGEDLMIKEIKSLGENQKKHIDTVKSELTKSIEDSKKELQEEVSSAKGTAQKALEAVEEVKAKQATSGMGGQGGGVKPFDVQLEENLEKSKNKLKGQEGKFNFDIQTKAPGNLSSAASLTGSYLVPAQTVPGLVMQPYNVQHLRSIIPNGNTNSNIIRYVRDMGPTNAGTPGMTAEGATKPQIDRSLQIFDAPVRKLAAYMRVPEEMIEDIPFLTGFLTNVGTEELLAIEDTQILYGDGTGQNLSGIGLSGNFTAFAADAGGAAASGVVAAPNNFDVLRFADKQMRVLKRSPNIALVSPVDYVKMISVKDTTNNYVLSGGGNGLIPTVNGFPVVQMNQVVAGDFFVLDTNAVQLFFRASLTVRFYEQDQDNAIKNLVTIVLEERVALPIYYITGIIKGTFAAAITDLTS